VRSVVEKMVGMGGAFVRFRFRFLTMTRRRGFE